MIVSIGERILCLRKANEISQEKLAELLLISRTKLSKIENDTAGIDIELAKKICEVFNISIDYLAYGVEENKKILYSSKRNFDWYFKVALASVTTLIMLVAIIVMGNNVFNTIFFSGYIIPIYYFLVVFLMLVLYATFILIYVIHLYNNKRRNQNFMKRSSN